METGSNPVSLVRRECYCAARSCGYGPSSAYTMAGYASPDRSSASRNAQRLERDDACGDRISYLTTRPDLALLALSVSQDALNETEGKNRNRKLKTVMKGRKKAKSKRNTPTPIAPPQKADNDSLADLLELILDEARALVDRCRTDGADTIVTKSAIDLHRSATTARERFLSVATDADTQSATTNLTQDVNVLKIHMNMQRELGETPLPLPKLDVQPETTVANTRDEEHLRYNVAVTLEQIDNLSLGKIPAIKDQIRLFEALLKSVVKLSQIISRRVVKTRSTSNQLDVLIDPNVFLRWADLYKISQ